MIAALIDNGSLEPAAHRLLRETARALEARAGLPVQAVSWRHSGRIPAGELGGVPAATLAGWLKERLSEGEREFLFVPFLISTEGAIASAIRADLEALARRGPDFSWSFAPGLGPRTLAEIVARRVRGAAARKGLLRYCAAVVDHGGPARASAELRDTVAEAARALLQGEAATVLAASMESPAGDDFGFNRPLLSELLERPGFGDGDVVVAPLFISPGRHAGPDGDLARIARAAEAARPGLRCHFCEPIGSHPLAIEALARSLSALSASI